MLTGFAFCLCFLLYFFNAKFFLLILIRENSKKNQQADLMKWMCNNMNSNPASVKKSQKENSGCGKIFLSKVGSKKQMTGQNLDYSI